MGFDQRAVSRDLWDKYMCFVAACMYNMMRRHAIRVCFGMYIQQYSINAGQASAGRMIIFAAFVSRPLVVIIGYAYICMYIK